MANRREWLKRFKPEEAASIFAGTKAGAAETRRRNWLARSTLMPRAGRYVHPLEMPAQGLPRGMTPYELGVEKFGARPGITPLQRATETADIALQEMRPPQAKERFGLERAGAEMDIAGKREIMRGAEQKRTQAAELHPAAVRTAAAGAGVAETGEKATKAEFERTQTPSYQVEQTQEKKRSGILKGLEQFPPDSLEAYRLRQEYMKTHGFKPGDTSPTADMMQRSIEGRQRQQAAEGVATNAIQASGLGQVFPDPETGTQKVIMPALENLKTATTGLTGDITNEGVGMLMEQLLRQLESAIQQAGTPEAVTVILNEIRNNDTYQDIVKWQDADSLFSYERLSESGPANLYYHKRFKEVAEKAKQIVAIVQGQ